MKTPFLLLLNILFLFNIVFAQQAPDYWAVANERNIEMPKNAVRNSFPVHYATFKLEIDQLKETLRKAPMEYTAAAKTDAVLVAIPMPDGELATFEVYESSVMHPNLAARFPMIKTYAGRGLSNPASSTRLSVTPKGFRAIVFQNDKSTVYVDAYALYQDKYYQSYYVKDLFSSPDLPKFVCGVSDEHTLNLYDEYVPTEHIEDAQNHDDHDHATDDNHHHGHSINGSPASSRTTMGEPVILRKYRTAIACTGEFGRGTGPNGTGGTVETALATIVTILNRLTGIFERDLAVRLELIEAQTDVIYLQGAADPYTNGSTDALLGENQPNMDAVLGPGAYDFGHIIGTGGWGGLASLGGPCGTSRAQAASIYPTSSSDDAFVVSIIAHEMGHQMGANHSMSFCHNVNSGTAYEVGAGTTIMSYAGICAGENGIDVNAVGGADDYYYTSSIEEMFRYMRDAGGNVCPEKIQTGNTEPDVERPYENNFYIPHSTPFEMTAIASDVDGDALTYCWEQLDSGPMSLPSIPEGNCPLFRSYPPTSNPTRVFPKMQTILSNQEDVFEDLPNYSRNMTFRCTVRDNNPAGGGIVGVTESDKIKFKCTEFAGPFLVTSPNNSVTWEVGQYREITWNVANTDKALVNCKTVDIYLSLDGGQNFDMPIALGVPNDGSEFILIPENLTTTARIKIKAGNNIFFDISNTNFEIAPPSAPNYSLAIAPNTAQVCLPETVVLDITTNSLLDYADPIQMDVISGLPADASFSFETNPVTPSESSQLYLDFGNVTVEDTFSVVVQAIAPNADTSYRTIELVTVSNDYSALETLSPEDGTSGASGLPEFTWIDVPDAEEYSIQIATSPTFEASTIIDEESGVTEQPYTPNLILEENTLYFWRVMPHNECGMGPATGIKAFHTESLSCSAANIAADTPIVTIGEKESKISVIADGIISDINIPTLKGSHPYMEELTLSLKSPAGTEVILFSEACLNSDVPINLSIDQQAPDAFDCPPVGLVRPQSESLSAFLGESTLGLWTLKIVDSNPSADNGEITDWSLEFCTNINLSNPQLILNEPMPVNPGMGRKLTSEFLQVIDDTNPEWQLKYTIVENTNNGKLYLDGVELAQGDHFVQTDVIWDRVRYVHDGSMTTEDDFLFTVEDGDGGWTGTHKFEIIVDENIVVSNDEVINENNLQIFPNPSNSNVNIFFANPISEKIKIELLNVQGQLLSVQQQNLNNGGAQLNVENLADGIYLLRVTMDEKTWSEKITVQK